MTYPQPNPSRSLRLFLIIATASMVFVGIGYQAMKTWTPAPANTPETAYTLTVLHTNDVHGHILPFNKYGNTCRNEAPERCFGGVARRATLIKQLRSEHPNTLLLDAGDQFQGTLFFTKFRGRATVHFMNRLGYDAMAIGNHEFDDGVAGLAAFAEKTDFPLLATNLDTHREPRLAKYIKPYLIREIGGKKVGIIGAITESSRYISSPGDTVDFQPIDAALTQSVNSLQAQGVDIVIALTHLGYQRDLDLANRIEGLDLVIGGHSHTPLGEGVSQSQGAYPTLVDGASGHPVLVVSAGDYGRLLGRLTLEFDTQGRLVRWDGAPIAVDHTIPEDPVILADAERFNQELEPFYTNTIGRTDIELVGADHDCRFNECNLGNLIADAMRWATLPNPVQIALTNGGGIRAGIPEGPITVAQVLEVFPFPNLLATFSIQGRNLRDVLEHSVSRADNPNNDGTGRFLQVSGLRFSWDPTRLAGERVRQIEVLTNSGTYAPLNNDAFYRVATSDFIRRGGDDYNTLESQAIDAYDHGRRVSDLIIEYIKSHQPINPELEGRIRRVHGGSNHAL